MKREVHARSLIIGPGMCQQDCSAVDYHIVCKAEQPRVSTSGGIVPHTLARLVARDLQIANLVFFQALSWLRRLQTLNSMQNYQGEMM